MSNHVEMHAHARDLFDRKLVRVALFVVIPAIIFVLVCIGIRVSQLGIDHTIVVIGQEELLADSPAAMRITLIADGSGFFLPDRVDGWLVRGETRHELFSGAVNEDGYALARNFRVPAMPPGPAVLELDIKFDDRNRKVRCDVKIVESPPPVRMTFLEDSVPGEVPLQVDDRGNLIQVMAEDRGAPTGLMSVLFVRTQDRDGDPASVPLDLGLMPASAKDPPVREKLQTDRLGLAALPIKPPDLDFPIRAYGASSVGFASHGGDAGVQVDAGAAAESRPAYLFPKVVYSGISPSVHNPIADRGESFRISVSQITMGGPLYADLFKEGRWVYATSTWVEGRGKAEMRIRAPVTGLVRAQFTNSALGSGRSIAVRHLYALEDGRNMNDGIRAVLGRLEGPCDGAWARAVEKLPLEGGAGFDRRLAAAFSLSRLYAGHQNVERLVSSRKEDDTELGAFKSKVQRGVMLVIILLGVSVALIIAMVAMGAHRRRSRLEAMIMDESDVGDEEHADSDAGSKARGARRRMIVQGAVLFIIIVGAFSAIALLVDTMTWGN